MPPFLMIHGKDDGVPFSQSVQMCASSVSATLSGNTCDLIALAATAWDTWEPHRELHFNKQKMVAV